jgi:hypothetical protein
MRTVIASSLVPSLAGIAAFVVLTGCDLQAAPLATAATSAPPATGGAAVAWPQPQAPLDATPISARETVGAAADL